MNLHLESLYSVVLGGDELKSVPATPLISMGVVLLNGPLPSSRELVRQGKVVARVRERWRTLLPELKVSEVMQVSHFPGTKHSALLAIFRPSLSRFRTWRDLVDVEIGKWHDVQLFESGRLLAFSLREEDCVFRFSGKGTQPRIDDCFGDVRNVSSEWFDFLNS